MINIKTGIIFQNKLNAKRKTHSLQIIILFRKLTVEWLINKNAYTCAFLFIYFYYYVKTVV